MASSAPPSRRPLLLDPKPDPDAPPPIPLTPDPCAALRHAKPDPDAAHHAQAETTPLTAEICAMLRRELEPSPDDHTEFAHRLRQTQQRLDGISARLLTTPPPPPPQAAPPPPPPPPPRAQSPPPPRADPKSPTTSANPARASSSTAGARGKKKKKRSRGTPGAEIVRATVTTRADLLMVRTVTRRARLTFEALRGLHHRAGRSRADMVALSAMLSRNLCLYRDKRIVGAVPGVFIGDVFSYRAELIVVGLHNHTQAGIGYVPASLVSEGHPVATSIVSSGGYLDDSDSGDVLVYTGSGGRARNAVEHHADQAFERGNLALAYSCKYGVEVRVVRCHDCDDSPSAKLYVYDGLYKVDSTTYGPGKSGRDVCKFNLVRIPGQDALGSNIWRDAKKLTDALGSGVQPPGYIMLDMSRGKEAVRVPVCNTVDQDRSPLGFEYIARPLLPPSTATAQPRLARRRRCCVYTTTACGGRCVCVKRNGGGGDPAYNADGTLVRGMPVVYECGAQCGCPSSCPNRATQRGMAHRLEVFRSEETEWGVRTLDLIQPGAFICEFTGVLVAVDDDDDNGRQSSSNARDWGGLLDPRKFPPRWREWGDASPALLPHEGERPPQFPQCAAPGYALDVSQRRNFAAFICHSSVPNAFVQFVIRGDENESCPHLMVFAMETIPPMCELTIDYGIEQ
uniref:Uncharacterized protein n=1 Tax=Avena sativa TaxID=4498 RepID=A0ACD5YYV0_AVESA